MRMVDERLSYIFSKWLVIECSRRRTVLGKPRKYDDTETEYEKELCKLYNRRTQLGVSLNMLALALGKSRPGLSLIENGKLNSENWLYIYSANYILDQYENWLDNEVKTA